MNVMDAVVQALEDERVEYAFGVPGAAILPLYEPILDGGVEAAGRMLGDAVPERD